MYGVSPHFDSSASTSEMVCNGSFSSAASNSRAVHTTEEESMPPLKVDPTGWVLRKRQRTASTKTSRKASPYSRNDPSFRTGGALRSQ